MLMSVERMVMAGFRPGSSYPVGPVLRRAMAACGEDPAAPGPATTMHRRIIDVTTSLTSFTPTPETAATLRADTANCDFFDEVLRGTDLTARPQRAPETASQPALDAPSASFTKGTRIKTARGEVQASALRIGDRVLTRDSGYQTVKWVGRQRFEAAQFQASPKARPVHIAAGALAPGMPERDMIVSPQHHLLVHNAALQLWFGEEEALIAARDLTFLPGVTRSAPADVEFVHFMCDRHELVMSDGQWSESFRPSEMSLAGLDPRQRDEIFALFPDLRDATDGSVYRAARFCLKSHQAQVVLRG